MSSRAAALPLSVVLLTCLPVRPASADPILITGGQFTIDTLPPGGLFFTGDLTLSGERGFTLAAGVSSFDGVFSPAGHCSQAQITPCLPGTGISLGGAFVGSGLRGLRFTIDGQTFSSADVPGGSFVSAAAFLSGSAVAPEFGDGTAVITAPFLFEGRIGHPGGSEALFGLGTANVSLMLFGPTVGLPPRWIFTSAQYEFAPVPEPATLLLTASGIAGLAGIGHRGRRRRRKPPAHPPVRG
jgi:hypothetical protein